MPELHHALRISLLTRLLALWVKPAVLPINPGSVINRELPILYVLERGGAADHAALEIVAHSSSLPKPSAKFVFRSVSESSSVDVLQRRRGTFFRKHRWAISAKMARIVEASVEHEASELQIVPVAVYWGRAPERESSLWKLWFSENWQIAGRTRKLLTTLLHGRHTLVSLSEPLSLNTLKSSGEPPEILTRKLARVLRVHFRQRRVATLGPDQSHRRMLVDHVMADQSVRNAIAKESTSTSIAKAQHRARGYANEIAADVSYPTVRVLHRLLTRLWNELYDGVELSGMERLKQVADGRELVYVPCHRSHIDYLLLSYILYVEGYSLPHIAAGINLNLPVVGGLLRRGGAFFLRRSFAGKPLYATVFNTYLKELLQRGHALEYFIEGGRSRSGRLLPPKGGMLAMTVHAYLNNPQTPVAFIPVYFGYERLLEGRAFTSELAGGKKQRESIFGLLRSLKTLREEYGRVYVSFGEPIKLDSLLDENKPQWRTEPIGDERPAWFKPVVDQLGQQIMRKINEAASVTPISLLATAILSTPRGCISQNDLAEQLDIYQRLIKSIHAGSLIVVPEIDVNTVIDHGCRLGFIERVDDDISTIVQLRPGQAAPLTYFKNNILHLFTLPALIAASFNGQRFQFRQKLHHLLLLTFPVIQSELFSSTRLSPDIIDQALDGLHEAGVLYRNENQWSRAHAGSTEAVLLLRLAQIVTPALERDYLCASVLAQPLTLKISSEELALQCKLCADRLARTHGRSSTELYDKHVHQVFVNTLQQHDYITQEDAMIVTKPSLLAVETEVRALLPESSRHAIIATAKAVAVARTNQQSAAIQKTD